MWASDLLKDGGSERVAWFGGPNSVLLEEVEGNSKLDKNTTSYLQTRSISSSSVDTDMESHHDFLNEALWPLRGGSSTPN